MQSSVKGRTERKRKKKTVSIFRQKSHLHLLFVYFLTFRQNLKCIREFMVTSAYTNRQRFLAGRRIEANSLYFF